MSAYRINEAKRNILDKDGDVIRIMAWEVIKGGMIREVFYSMGDALKYADLMHKRDADYKSLTGLD